MKRFVHIILATAIAVLALVTLFIASPAHAGGGGDVRCPDFVYPYPVTPIQVEFTLPCQVSTGHEAFTMEVRIKNTLPKTISFDGFVWHGGPAWGYEDYPYSVTVGEVYHFEGNQDGHNHFWRGQLKTGEVGTLTVPTFSGKIPGGPFFFANAMFVVTAPQGIASNGASIRVMPTFPAPAPSALGSTDVAVTVDPISAFVLVGNKTNVVLHVNSRGQDVDSFFVDLEYDPTIVEMMRATVGDLVKPCSPLFNIRTTEQDRVHFELSGAALDCDLTVQFKGLREGVSLLSIPGRTTTSKIIVRLATPTFQITQIKPLIKGELGEVMLVTANPLDKALFVTVLVTPGCGMSGEWFGLWVEPNHKDAFVKVKVTLQDDGCAFLIGWSYDRSEIPRPTIILPIRPD